MIHFMSYVLLVFSVIPSLSLADAPNPYTISIKDHKFDPPQLTIPAGQKIKLTIDNEDSTPEEFESYQLNREKIVAGGKQIIIYIGPLKPGSYKYFGDFHKDIAQGIIIVQ